MKAFWVVKCAKLYLYGPFIYRNPRHGEMNLAFVDLAIFLNRDKKSKKRKRKIGKKRRNNPLVSVFTK